MDDKHIDYEFKAVNDNDYELTLSMMAKNKHLNKIFNMAKQKLMKDKGVDFDGDIEKVSKFKIDKQYLNVIKTIIRRKVRWIEKRLKQGKIEVLTSDVDKCYFERNEERDWCVYIHIKGNYVDKR